MKALFEQSLTSLFSLVLGASPHLLLNNFETKDVPAFCNSLNQSTVLCLNFLLSYNTL